eukprot:g3881.t1
MPKKKSHVNGTPFGQGHKLFRGKKARQNMFKKGGITRKKGDRTAGGKIAAGNGGRFKRGSQAGQAQKPSPKQAQQLGLKQALPKQKRDEAGAKQAQQLGPKQARPKQKRDEARAKQAQQFRSTYVRAHKLYYQGKIDEAVPLCREALMGQRVLLGDTHKDTFNSASLLGHMLQTQGVRYGKEPVFREMQEGWRALVEAQRARQRGGAAREGMLQPLENLVLLHGLHGASDETELLARELLVGRSALLGRAVLAAGGREVQHTGR